MVSDDFQCSAFVSKKNKIIITSGAIWGKTGKTAKCKIEHGGGSSGAAPYYGGLTLPGHMLINGLALANCEKCTFGHS